MTLSRSGATSPELRNLARQVDLGPQQCGPRRCVTRWRPASGIDQRGGQVFARRPSCRRGSRRALLPTAEGRAPRRRWRFGPPRRGHEIRPRWWASSSVSLSSSGRTPRHGSPSSTVSGPSPTARSPGSSPVRTAGWTATRRRAIRTPTTTTQITTARRMPITQARTKTAMGTGRSTRRTTRRTGRTATAI
jgi:hypothetical protein